MGQGIDLVEIVRGLLRTANLWQNMIMCPARNDHSLSQYGPRWSCKGICLRVSLNRANGKRRAEPPRDASFDWHRVLVSESQGPGVPMKVVFGFCR